MDAFFQDVRYVVRALLKRPGFTAVVVLTLALGIGANTAIFSVINAVLLAPLPYDDPDRLMVFWGESPQRSSRNTSEPDFLDYRKYRQVFEDIGAVTGKFLSLTSDGEPQRLNAAAASANFLPLLGVRPFMGRHFSADEDRWQGPDAALLTHHLWQRRFGGDPNVVGKVIQLDGKSHTVVGVLPKDFQLRIRNTFLLKPPMDIWVPLKADYERNPRSGRYLLVVGRLEESASMGDAHAEADRIWQQIKSENVEYADSERRIRLVPLYSDLVGEVNGMLVLLMAAVGFVLFIACMNVANMVLARAAAQDRELTLRAALGASRGRLLQQMLTETLVLALAGGALGVVFSAFGLRSLLPLLPAELPRVDQVAMDERVLGFTLAVALVTGLVLGIIPGLRSSRPRLVDALQQGGRSGSSGRHRVQRLFIVMEVALSIALLVGAGLMIRSFLALKTVPTGFDSENVLTFAVELPEGGYPGDQEVAVFFQQLSQKLEAIPGVEAVGMTNALPLSGRGMRMSWHRLGDDEDHSASYQPITPGFFHALDTKLLAGRFFSSEDHADSRRVAIVNQNLAQRAWPGENPIGQRLDANAVSGFRPFQIEELAFEVVGVVEHIRHHDLSQGDGDHIFVPHSQVAISRLSVVVRGPNPMNLLGAIRREVSALDKTLPLAEVRRMEEYEDEALGSTRLVMTLLGILATFAILLASVGIYALLSYMVNQRTKEVGIRMALGATRGGVFRLVVGQGMTLVLVGVLLGLASAIGLTRYLRNQLFGVGTTDPVTIATITVLLVAVSFLACFVPARRAIATDPSTAIRYE